MRAGVQRVYPAREPQIQTNASRDTSARANLNAKPDTRCRIPDTCHLMKIATWNVNGIRARQAELQSFIEREVPDVLCLQEIKAGVDQLPVWVCELEGYWCYWHGGKGYSGVGLHVRKATHPERPVFHHPEFDYEH